VTPAETMRRAAALMRARANAARSSASGRWIVRPTPHAYPQQVMEDGVPTLVAETFTGPQHPPAHADHIAAADPVLMLAVADWLEQEAADLAAFEAQTGPIGEPATGHWAHALDISGLYLRDGWRAER
jgi:hypothetical protein